MPPKTTPDEGGTPDEGKTTAGSDRTFTQDEIDEIVERRLRRERSKYANYDELQEKAGKFDKLEQDGQGELERAVRRAEAAEGRADRAEAVSMRLEVAVEKGLTPTQAKRLVGKDRDELEADADELLEAFGGKKGDGDDPGNKTTGDKSGATSGGDGEKPDPRRRPQERLRSGETGETEPEKTGKEIADEIAKSQF